MSCKGYTLLPMNLPRIALSLLLLATIPRNFSVQSISAQIFNDDCSRQIDLESAVQKLGESFKGPPWKLDRLEVLHINTNRLFRASVSSAFLRQHYDFKLTNRYAADSASVRKLVELLNKIRSQPSKSTADLRWGFIFLSGEDETLFEIYFDASGQNGVVNGSCFDFGDRSLAQWATGTFGQAFQ